MIDDGVGAESSRTDRVFALLFVDGEHLETHGIYTSVERAMRAFVSLATSGLVDARGGAYTIEEYPLDQPFMGTVIVGSPELLGLLETAGSVLPGE
jgi:hypothetical protein